MNSTGSASPRIARLLREITGPSTDGHPVSRAPWAPVRHAGLTCCAVAASLCVTAIVVVLWF